MHAQYDSTKAKEAIEKVLRERNLPEYSPFDDGTERRCRVYVRVAMPLNKIDPSSRTVCYEAKNTRDAKRIRSYKQKSDENIPATISEAALATSAATRYYQAVIIDGSQYVARALRYNNLVTEVEADAKLLWCPDQVELKSLIKCFLSIGTGQLAKGAKEDNALKLAFGSIIKIVTDTEETHRCFNDRWFHLRRNRCSASMYQQRYKT